MKWTRFDFLKSFSLLPLAAAATKIGSATRTENNAKVKRDLSSIYDPYVEIYPENMRHNVRQIYRAVEGRPILAVIKNNGYGMGVVESARIMEPMDPIEGFGVVKMGEAVRLREAGIRKPIVLMTLLDERELEEVVRLDITPMIYTPVGDQLERLATRLQKPISVEVKLDTGLGRLGVREGEALEFYRDLAGRRGISVRGSMITFTEAEEFDLEQIVRYNRLMERLDAEGLEYGARHAVSTTPIFRHPDAWFDKVRPGIGLYGIYPEPDRQRPKGLMDLRPAFGLKCRVIHVKKLHRGETAGYGQAFEAEEDTWLATLPIGHADGWQRGAASCAKVRIRGELHPVVASVSASHSLVNLGPETGVEIGDEAVIFDVREGSRADDIHSACGVSTYDLLMHISPQLRRVWV